MIRQELNPETCRLDTKTMKLTMHPTNNRSTSEWSSGSESTSKRINKPAIVPSAMSRRNLANK